jgi:hypothetical protein
MNHSSKDNFRKKELKHCKKFVNHRAGKFHSRLDNSAHRVDKYTPSGMLHNLHHKEHKLWMQRQIE